MVIAAGTALRRAKVERYSKRVQELEQILKEAGVEKSEKAKSLDFKTGLWGSLSYWCGLMFGTSPFGAPAFGAMIEKWILSMGYHPSQVEGTNYTYGLLVPTITYFLGSMIGWATCACLNEYYADAHIKELETQAKQYQQNLEGTK